MNTFLVIASVVILLTVLIGLIQIWRGGTRADQMLSALLFGTAGVAILILFSTVTNNPVLVDVALVFAILALVVTVAFVRTTSENFQVEEVEDECDS